MKRFKIIVILFLLCKIVLAQNKKCEFNNANDIVNTYTICNIDTLNDGDVSALILIKKNTTNKELKNLFNLKEDESFRKILKEHSLDMDFSFPTVNDMFNYCNVDISEKYNFTQLQLDKSFIKKDLLNKLKVGKIVFFYFDKDFNSEINLYNYVYCQNKYLDFYSLNNSMLLSTNNPFDDVCDKKIIGLEETENFKLYTMPIIYKKKCIYMSIYFIKDK